MVTRSEVEEISKIPECDAQEENVVLKLHVDLSIVVSNEEVERMEEETIAFLKPVSKQGCKYTQYNTD